MAYLQKQDNLHGECQKKDREISILKEERDRLTARAEDTRQLLAIMTESKEVATKLVKSHIVRADNFQRELELLKIELAKKETMEEKLRALSIALETAQKELREAKAATSKQVIMVDRSVYCDDNNTGIKSSVSIQESGTNTDPMEDMDNTKNKVVESYYQIFMKTNPLMSLIFARIVLD